MTFHELCQREGVTPGEREQLAWFLAMHRAHATFEELRYPPAGFRQNKGPRRLIRDQAKRGIV
jgi:hypothetical protein